MKDSAVSVAIGSFNSFRAMWKDNGVRLDVKMKLCNMTNI